MSRTLLFEIGAVIFVAVAAAIFLFGLAVVRELQDQDEAVTRADADHPSLAPVQSQTG